MRTTGNDGGGLTPSPLSQIFEAQGAFQKEITGLELPTNNVDWFAYHMLAMQEEMGELLKADKRWKTHRNTAYDRENKLEELADCYITLVNISLYSGFSAEEVAEKIVAKIAENTQKWRDKQNVDNR